MCLENSGWNLFILRKREKLGGWFDQIPEVLVPLDIQASLKRGNITSISNANICDYHLVELLI